MDNTRDRTRGVPRSRLEKYRLSQSEGIDERAVAPQLLTRRSRSTQPGPQPVQAVSAPLDSVPADLLASHQRTNPLGGCPFQTAVTETVARN
jgi:hypothetical protein